MAEDWGGGQGHQAGERFTGGQGASTRYTRGLSGLGNRYKAREGGWVQGDHFVKGTGGSKEILSQA